MIKTYFRLLSYLRPYRLGVAGALLCMLVLALTTGLYAYLVGPVLEFVMTGGEKGGEAIGRLIPRFTGDPQQVIQMLPFLVFGVAAVKGVAYLGQFYLMGMTGQRVIVDLRRHMFRHLLTMSSAWFDRSHSGDLISRFTNDLSKVETAITHAASSIARDLLQVLVLLGVAFYLDWRLSIIAFGVMPVTAVPAVRFARRLRRVTVKANAAMGRITEIIHEAIGGIRVVQAFTREKHEQARFDAENAEFVSVMRRSFLVRGLSSPTMEIMGATGIAAVLWYGTDAITGGTVEAGKFLSFFTTVLLLYAPVKSLGRLGQFVVTGAASVERVFEILDTEAEIRDAPDASVVLGFEDRIVFEGVGFDYERGSERPTLRDVDLEIPKGTVLALVGPSGGGKTTLALLLPRFYDPTQGRITLDGRPLASLTLASLRGLISVVSQETIIFSDTVRSNVTYGNPDASEEAVWQALERAQAHLFVRELDRGLDTPLGERGVTLSGGQRQRLAIARALLKDAPILILDEATSSLDTESERAVQSALSELMQGRTVVVIAHRLSTIRHADRIVVLDEGRIVEEGSHEALLAEGGLYRRLHDLQGFGGHPPDDSGSIAAQG